MIDGLNLAHLQIEGKWKRVDIDSIITHQSGKAFRCCKPKYADDENLLSGEGSFKHGGRWMPAGQFHLLYASESASTAAAEVAQPARRGIDVDDQADFPLVTRRLEYFVRRMIDLTDEVVLGNFGVSRAELVGEQSRVRQGQRFGTDGVASRLGLFLAKMGVEGLIVPSAADTGGRNLVFFKENLMQPSFVRIRDGGFPEKLRV